MNKNQRNTMLVAAHDAGGAEMLCAWIQANSVVVDVVAEGPAKSIFIREGCASMLVEKFNVSDYQQIITGTSFTAVLERQIIQQANERGIPCIAVLDHWMHYSERFQVNATLVLPSTLWVGDQFSEQLAKSIFTTVPILRVENFYWEKMKKNVALGRHGCWLIAMENRITRNQSWEESLHHMLGWLCRQSDVTEVIIRPHPTHNATQVAEYIQSLMWISVPLSISSNSLVHDLSSCTAVLGYQTTVLALACITQKRAVSLVMNDEKLSIPLPEVEVPFGKRIIF
jgi:hypothetical protein